MRSGVEVSRWDIQASSNTYESQTIGDIETKFFEDMSDMSFCDESNVYKYFWSYSM